MAHFYGSIQGNRGEATITGSKNSGIIAHIRGCSIGVRVHCEVDSDGNDIIYVYKIGGSSGRTSGELLIIIKEEN